ncbi:aspartate--tRNA(Asn) ligase [Candidatus Pacearchaeota archaeon CG10_big_fil_rev_8_21_14_0_10_35_13]|nr:MAG: aspartate--tRNA(Asn) ligase [Candidatus Pacearchaeota archaeon CG10_big_fil_rev_8_21_14_0_10_35_13]
MKDRRLIGNLGDDIGKRVNLGCWVDGVRDLKNMQFVILRDHTGKVQAVNKKAGKPLDDLVSSLRPESVVRISGEVVQSRAKLNGYEVIVDDVEVVSEPKEPSPIDSESGIDKRLDYRHIDLRDPKKFLIFKTQTTAEQAMREFWINNGFVEIHSPKLVAGASESGAELFQLDYFGTVASLAQSPQFYKQMAMAAGFDRVFEIGPVFRANKSHTSRHDTEFTSVDMELSWIDSHEDVMAMEERWIEYFMTEVQRKHGEELSERYGAQVEVPRVPFPRVTMEEAYSILKSQGYEVPDDKKGDLDLEGERILGRYVKENHNHEFVLVTDYPASVRPFYHMRSDDNPEITKSFDLIWKGTEVTTGAQREHRYDRLVNQIEEKGIDPKSLRSYTEFFKHGCPPHGGCGFGLTRMLMNITGEKSVKEVTFVYRGPNRITP